MGGGKITPKEWRSQLDTLTEQAAEAKAEYAGIVKDIEMLAEITEIATRVYRTKTKAAEQEKEKAEPQQKRKNEQSL